eukprot:TRINITY_DN23877_c0_g1_i1.p1 TRINITY_DN23877_c0_g1~~TRINITY_DN23877_c0_g1_i1.p1  ORF type:complete len:139 (-),score=44.57 TRINITY_DN23877_c0_g1_i1:80-496(-)
MCIRDSDDTVQREGIENSDIDRMITIEPNSEKIIWDTGEYSDSDYDSEDSNDAENPNNEYPDEEEEDDEGKLNYSSDDDYGDNDVLGYDSSDEDSRNFYGDSEDYTKVPYEPKPSQPIFGGIIQADYEFFQSWTQARK